MGAQWRPYQVGKYRLNRLAGEACAVWRDDTTGRRHRFRLGVRSEAEGRAELARFARRADAAQALSVSTAGAIWEAYVADRERDGKGMGIYRENWKALRPAFAALTPDEIGDDTCRAYAESRFALGRKPATVATELVRLRTALNWAAKRRIIAAAPHVWVPSPGAPRSRTLTEHEIAAILDACEAPHIRLFAVLALATGGRHSAILELTWDRVDFAAGSIDLRVPRVVAPMSKRHWKGRAQVAMNGLARAALDEARAAATGAHVIEWNGRPVRSVKKAFAAAVRRAGLDGVTPHTFRHSVASLQWAAGIDPHVVARFLGHRDVKTTSQIYAKPAPAYTAGAAAVVDFKGRKVS